MSHFCLLSDPQNYTVQDWDLVQDAQGRAYWLKHFGEHMDHVLEAAMVRYGPTAKGRCRRAREAFSADLARLAETPDCLPGGLLRVIDLCRLREKALRDNMLPDPYGHIKQRENEAAIALYPELIERLDAMDAPARWLHIIECAFAGNVFDLGSRATMRFASEDVDFLATLEQLPPRPWLVDDYDRLAEFLPVDDMASWTKAVIFVDNAGADFVLGAMALARELALAGVQIVLAANEQPSLNDITVEDTEEIVTRLAAEDDALRDLIAANMFEVASTGNDLPLIDLSDVSDELNAAAEGADLVVLEGMGRSVESNFDTPFTCDALRLCMLKDEAIAARIGGKVFDVVCKFHPIADPATLEEQSESAATE